MTEREGTAAVSEPCEVCGATDCIHLEAGPLHPNGWVGTAAVSEITTWDVPLADAMYQCCIDPIPDTDHDDHVMEHLRRNGWTFVRLRREGVAAVNESGGDALADRIHNIQFGEVIHREPPRFLHGEGADCNCYEVVALLREGTAAVSETGLRAALKEGLRGTRCDPDEAELETLCRRVLVALAEREGTAVVETTP